MLILYPATSLNLLITSNSFGGVFRISHLQIHPVALPFQFWCLLCLLLTWFFLVELSVLCWIGMVKVGILDLYLILIMLQTFIVEYNVNCEFVTYSLILPNKIQGLLVSMSSDAEQRGDTGTLLPLHHLPMQGAQDWGPRSQTRQDSCMGPSPLPWLLWFYGVLGGKEEAKGWREALPLSYTGAWTCTAGCWGRQM